MSLSKLKIGSVEIENNLVLAPMSGVTNSCFRRLIREENPGAVGLVVTEFISIEALTRKVPRSLQMLKFREEERPISIQIFGHDISRMVESAQMVEAAGADILDINCGCPAPKVVRRGGGCELMRQPQHLAEILSAVRKVVSIPLTLKIRSGWCDESTNALEVAEIAQDCGVDGLAVHGRTREALYRGEADWKIVSEIAKILTIPVIGSGDVIDPSSARKAVDTGVSGLMIGRAALANPWVFSEISSSLSEGRFARPSDVDTVRVMLRYMELLSEELPEKAVIGRMKQLGSQVTRRVAGSSDVRRELCRSQSLEEFRDRLSAWRELLGKNNSYGFLRESPCISVPLC